MVSNKKILKGKTTQSGLSSCVASFGKYRCEIKKCAIKFVVLVAVLTIIMFGFSGIIITKWVNNNPEVLIESLNKHVMELQQKAQEEQKVKAKETLPAVKNQIMKDKSFPKTINRRADVTIIQFADYNCGYCKSAAKTIHKLVQNDKKVEVIFIELPIFGGLSTEAAKVGLAVNKINPAKYYDFHYNMMEGNAREKSGIYDAVKKTGLDVSEVKRTVERNSADFDNKLAKNRMIAQSLGLNGTPAFIIGDELIPGAVQYEQAVMYVKEARK
jgi:protein-disulfide isomerase